MKRVSEDRFCVKYIIPVKVLCFDTLLQVLILKGVSSCWLLANPWGVWRLIPSSKDTLRPACGGQALRKDSQIGCPTWA